jgi:AcrR family transcriptional regulator
MLPYGRQEAAMAGPPGATYRRIMESALRELSAGGYASVSMQRVADGAGVSKPTVYYYFDSKEGLFAAMLSEIMDGIEELIRLKLGYASSLREGVEELLDCITAPPDRPGGGIASVSLAFSHDSGLRKRFPWMTGRLRDLVGLTAGIMAAARDRGEIRPGVDVRLAAEMLISAVRTCLLESDTRTDGAGMDGTGELVDILFGGIGRGPGRES